MSIAEIDISTKNELKTQYLTEGIIVLPRVTLPTSFAPPATDVVFLRLGDDSCEIYIGSDTSYGGSAPIWREVEARPEGAGRTKYVTSIRGDFFGALEAFEALMQEGIVLDAAIADAHAAAPPPSLNQHASIAGVSRLTDMHAVQEGLRDLRRVLYLDEDELFNRLQAKIRGQDDALRSLATATARHCARLQPARPSVIFSIGPSGVGKTQTAHVLAEILAEGDEGNGGYQFLRLDMTEYQEAYRVSQLLGAPQGYVGHGEGSQLLDALQASEGKLIILFDEIEKAHPHILRVLMNAMDAGRLSSASATTGDREIDCRQAIFMFTSNLDAKAILDELESRAAFGDYAVQDDICRRRLHTTGIAPKIVGRIGRFLVYRPLSIETRAEILALAVADVAQEYGVEVAFIDPSVIIHLMEKTRSQSFGVRPERFLIDNALGGIFAKTASQGQHGSIQVVGPPFQCIPVTLPPQNDTNLNDE